MSVRPSASRTEEGARETGKGLVARTWRRSKAVGGGSLGSRGLMSGSVRRAADRVESISAGRRGGGPPKKPMAFCASRESSASLSGSPPVPALVCSLSPVRIWRQERGRLAARAVKPASCRLVLFRNLTWGQKNLCWGQISEEAKITSSKKTLF